MWLCGDVSLLSSSFSPLHLRRRLPSLLPCAQGVPAPEALPPHGDQLPRQVFSPVSFFALSALQPERPVDMTSVRESHGTLPCRARRQVPCAEGAPPYALPRLRCESSFLPVFPP